MYRCVIILIFYFHYYSQVIKNKYYRTIADLIVLGLFHNNDTSVSKQ